jgi:nucleotide-binding universal stress UspA family protein
MEEEAQEYMFDEVLKLREEGAKVKGITREGPVSDTILEVARETQADMIAMSTHGYSGVQRWLMGSVADKVVSHSTIPVMLIHPISPN